MAAVYGAHTDHLVPSHVAIPTLKIAAGTPKQGEQSFLTPRSLAAAEKAVAEQEDMAFEAEAAAAAAAKAAEAALHTPRAAAAADAAAVAASKALATERSVAATVGTYEVPFLVHRTAFQ